MRIQKKKIYGQILTEKKLHSTIELQIEDSKSSLWISEENQMIETDHETMVDECTSHHIKTQQCDIQNTAKQNLRIQKYTKQN